MSDDNIAHETQTALSLLAKETRQLGEWQPQQAKLRDSQAQLLKEYARAIKDWQMLDDAVDQEISDQQNLVEWWRENVQGEGRPKKTSADRRQFEQAEAEKVGGIEHQKISKWRKYLKGDRAEYRDLLRGPSWRKAMGERGSSDEKGASGTGENEWFTPSEYIETARAVLGDIDLDPASSAQAQEIVRAAAFFSKQNSGLVQEWHGRIWLNPPYAQPLIAQFISKLVAERLAGHITAAISLTHNYTDTAWFHELVSVADAICFTRGRVKFYEGDKIAAPTQGQAFAYLGNDVSAFASIFSAVGFIVVPWRRRDV